MLPFDIYEIFRLIGSSAVVDFSMFMFCLAICAFTVKVFISRRGIFLAKVLNVFFAVVLVVVFLFTYTYRMQIMEDYAYILLESENPHLTIKAMRYLVGKGEIGRMINTLNQNSASPNMRLYIAMVLAKKDPIRSRDVLSSVAHFDAPWTFDGTVIFGTNQYAYPVAGTNIININWQVFD